jgi:hypothetical protein
VGVAVLGQGDLPAAGGQGVAHDPVADQVLLDRAAGQGGRGRLGRAGPGGQVVDEAGDAPEPGEAALVVVDAVAGVQVQTEKVWKFTEEFALPRVIVVNKLDRDGREPVDLLDDIESVLDIKCAPMTWPMFRPPPARNTLIARDQ